MSRRDGKHRGTWIVKIGFGVPVAFVLMQLGIWLFGGGRNFTTRPATISEVGSGITVSGFVVREEVMLPATGLTDVLCCEAGEWVGAGQVIARCFASQEDAAQEQRRQSLLAEANRLKAALRDENPPGAALLALKRGEMDAAGARAALLCAGCGDEEIRSRIRALEEAAAAIAAHPLTELTAPQAGYYYPSADGWERQLTKEALELQPKLEAPDPVWASGKLITSNEWYYVTNVPTEQVKRCRVGERVTVQLTAEIPAVEMRIASIREETGGSSVLILKSDRYADRVAELRTVPARLLFHVQRGLRIEKQALWLDENGQTGVYVLRGAQAVWKQVCLIADGGEFYLVQRETADNGLQEGEAVICASEPLTNGKVIDP